MMYLSLVSTDKMLSGKVTDKMGEDYGKISELLVDPASGKIAMAVLSYGGLLGMGDTKKLIPWVSLQMNPNTYDFQISVDKQMIDTAPALDADDVADRQRLSELYRHYGSPAFWEDTANFGTQDPVYKEAKVNDHEQYEGSSQISAPHRTPEENNKFTEDVDTDKLEDRPSERR